ncbi:hypothetical protein G4Y73_05625 [Wenzhouxiangella sp. XN201]|uniref:hypothetical protein n=1 Tax=Wenzhouxiangella sp. XN201 TaxID=2710755 RepID=UPI0013C8E46B|nr:hypothetical protein [Wenzhouxiangella sp. XN201]
MVSGNELFDFATFDRFPIFDAEQFAHGGVEVEDEAVRIDLPHADLGLVHERPVALFTFLQRYFPAFTDPDQSPGKNEPTRDQHKCRCRNGQCEPLDHHAADAPHSIGKFIFLSSQLPIQRPDGFELVEHRPACRAVTADPVTKCPGFTAQLCDQCIGLAPCIDGLLKRWQGLPQQEQTHEQLDVFRLIAPVEKSLASFLEVRIVLRQGQACAAVAFVDGKRSIEREILFLVARGCVVEQSNNGLLLRLGPLAFTIHVGARAGKPLEGKEAESHKQHDREGECR